MAGGDLIGYGPNSPVVEWPNGARIAVSFVVNYEEGSENSILDGYPHGETVGESPSPVARGERDLANESFFEYGTRVGVWRILDLPHMTSFPSPGPTRATPASPATRYCAATGRWMPLGSSRFTLTTPAAPPRPTSTGTLRRKPDTCTASRRATPVD